MALLAASRPMVAAAAAGRASSPAMASRIIAAAAARGYATPAGPPPQGFRQTPYKRWDEDPESSLDKLGRYFLLTEMFRGMYVLLEQFFRPPYTIYYPFEKVRIFPSVRGSELESLSSWSCPRWQLCHWVPQVTH